MGSCWPAWGANPTTCWRCGTGGRRRWYWAARPFLRTSSGSASPHTTRVCSHHQDPDTSSKGHTEFPQEPRWQQWLPGVLSLWDCLAASGDSRKSLLPPSQEILCTRNIKRHRNGFRYQKMNEYNDFKSNIFIFFKYDEKPSLLLYTRFWKMAGTFTGIKLQGLIGHFGNTTTTDIEGYVELPDGKVCALLFLHALTRFLYTSQEGLEMYQTGLGVYSRVSDSVRVRVRCCKVMWWSKLSWFILWRTWSSFCSRACQWEK